MKAWLAVGALAAVLAVSGCGGNGDKAKVVMLRNQACRLSFV